MFRQTGGSEADKAPLFIEGAHCDGSPGRGHRVLLLHGFSGTPFEVGPLARALASQGFSVAAPVLAGHAKTVEALARTRWQDWLASAELALDDLLARNGGRPVAIAGFSLGGLLALRMARARGGAVGALALMSAALQLPAWHLSAIRALGRVPGRMRRHVIDNLPKLGGFDVGDPELRGRIPSLRSMPLVGLESLLEFGSLVRADLPAVTTPTLVTHGLQDRTVPFRASVEVMARLGSAIRERLWLPRSRHLVCLDVERRILSQTVARFFSARLSA